MMLSAMRIVAGESNGGSRGVGLGFGLGLGLG
jgi:hypothetical protein